MNFRKTSNFATCPIWAKLFILSKRISPNFIKYECQCHTATLNILSRAVTSDIRDACIKLKGILSQKKFNRPNLIFWIVMGCGWTSGGPNGPKICARRTKTDFKDWAGCLEVSSRVTLRSHVQVASKSQGQTLGPKFSIFGVFWPFRPKPALPHPISIQNMSFGR